MTTEERRPAGGASRNRLRLLAGILFTAAALVAVPACSDSNDDAPSPGATGNGGAIVTGSAGCDQTSMQKAVESWSEAYGDGEKASLPESAGSYRCADGWAVAFPDVGSGETAVTVTAVFEAEGQFWIPKDRTKVCGDTAADSEVPKSLFEEACQTN